MSSLIIPSNSKIAKAIAKLVQTTRIGDTLNNIAIEGSEFDNQGTRVLKYCYWQHSWKVFGVVTDCNWQDTRWTSVATVAEWARDETSDPAKLTIIEISHTTSTYEPKSELKVSSKSRGRTLDLFLFWLEDVYTDYDVVLTRADRRTPLAHDSPTANAQMSTPLLEDSRP